MKVIVAFDDSPYSKELVESVTKRKWPADTEFRLLTVLEPIDTFELDLDEAILGLHEKRVSGATELCQDARHKIMDSVPGAIVHYEVRPGVPKNEIINAAVEWSADKILIGAHGHRGCPHNLLGSVSRAVTAHAPCSVEVIRSKTHSKESTQAKKQATVEA